MDVLEFNPIENITVKDNITMLTTNYMLCDYFPYGGMMNHITDNKFMEFGAFVYDEKDIYRVLTLDKEQLTLFELKEVRTTTDPSMMKQTIRFDIIIPPIFMGKELGIYNLTTKCIVHPKLIYMNGELLVCFLVDDIDKARSKKIKKIMNKENATS